MGVGALFAQRIPLKEREVVGVRDLDEFAIREPIPTPAASERLGLAKCGRHDVLAATLGMPDLEVDTLAVLAEGTERNLVGRGKVVLGRDEPDLLDRVEADLVAVLSVELTTALDAGLGFLPGLGSSGVGHEAALRGPGLGVFRCTAGAIFI